MTIPQFVKKRRIYCTYQVEYLVFRKPLIIHLCYKTCLHFLSGKLYPESIFKVSHAVSKMLFHYQKLFLTTFIKVSPSFVYITSTHATLDIFKIFSLYDCKKLSGDSIVFSLISHITIKKVSLPGENVIFKISARISCWSISPY